MIGTSARNSPKHIVATTAAFLLAIIALDCPLLQYYHSSVETNKNYAPKTLHCLAFRTSILPSSIRQPVSSSSSSSLLPASLYHNKGKFIRTRQQENSLIRSTSRRRIYLSMTNATAEITSASLEASDSLNSSSILQTYIDSLLSGSSSSSLYFCKIVPSSYTASDLTRDLAQQNTTKNATSTLIRDVNTIVFRPVGSVDNESENDIPIYAVAILPSSEKVDVRRFSQELQAFQAEQQSSQNNSAGIDLVGGIHHHQYDDWELAPSDMVQKLCGFRPGTIPPLLVPPMNNAIAGSSNTSTIDITEGVMSHINRPFATIVDSSLLWSNSTSSSNGDNTMNSRQFILGGGGSADRLCLIDLEFFLRDVLNVSATNSEHRNAKIASIIRFDGGNPNVYSGSTNDSRKNEKRQDQSQQQQNAPIEQSSANNNAPNPFFQIAPPIDATAMGLDGSQQSFPTAEQRASHRPIPVTAIGRLSSVRQIAKKLVFADFCPPDYNLRCFNNNNHSQRDEAKATSNNHLQRPPWRSGEDGMDMHVQIIVGKTFCERYDDGMQRLKTLKPGKLVFIWGAANVDPMQKNGWRNSAGNWAQKRSLDVIVSSFEILDEAENDTDDSMRRLVEEAQREVASRGSTTATSTNGMNTNWNSLLPWERKNDFERRAIAGSINTNGSDTFDATNELTLSRFNSHLRDTPLGIRIVNDDDSVQNMVTEVSELFARIEKNHHQAKNNNNDNLLDYVAGIDCEWRPTGAYAEALLEGPDDNPVALLQICLPIIDAVYLVDTHRLLRSNLDEHETMTENETLLSEAIELIFGSKTMIKAGYSVVIDFRRLAASFPHVPSFKTVRSVVELSYLAERLHPKSSKPLLGSLQKLTKLVLGYNIAKEEQCSNWEARPLSSNQIEYATLDCALPPRLLDEMAEGSGNAKIREVLPGVTRSYRFQTIDSSRKDAIRRLKAKRVVGNTFLISQCWLSDKEEPVPTSIPEENGGPYIDTDGILKMPADVIRIGHVNAPWRSMSGKTVLKSSESGPGGKKSDCINLLVGDTLPQDTVLECSPRSGFIEFKDGLALFVNMQDPNRPSRRKMPYPNDFLEDGRILTWYIRKKDWNNGNSEVAKLLLGSHSNNGSQTDDSVESISIPSSVVLFVRVGSGDFVCCGSCTATEANDYSSSKLAKLNLRLNDWHKMKDTAAFSKLLGDLVPRTKPALSSEDDPSVFRKNLAQVIVDGNMVGAFGMALDTFKVSTENRSISYARNCVANILCGSNDPLVLEAMEILDKMTI